VGLIFSQGQPKSYWEFANGLLEEAPPDTPDSGKVGRCHYKKSKAALGVTK